MLFYTQGFFSEEGLTKLWSELVKDGEVKGTGASYQDYQKQEAESVKFKSSPFETFLAEWTWGEVSKGHVNYVNGVDTDRCS